jgi:hypothetical protein
LHAEAAAQVDRLAKRLLGTGAARFKESKESLELVVLRDECRDKGASRYNLQPFCSYKLKRSADKLRAYAAAGQGGRNLGMYEGDYARRWRMIGHRDFAIGLQLEAVT